MAKRKKSKTPAKGKSAAEVQAPETNENASADTEPLAEVEAAPASATTGLVESAEGQPAAEGEAQLVESAEGQPAAEGEARLVESAEGQPAAEGEAQLVESAEGQPAAEGEARLVESAEGEPAAEGQAPLTGGANGETPPGEPLSESQLESIVESLLFASDKALGLSDLKRLLGERDGKKISAAVESLIERRKGTGIEVIALSTGWHLRTSAENASWVSKLLVGRPVRLSRAMLETLAIVSYRQPVTRPEVDDIRGVDCGAVLKTLLDRGLIRII